MIFRGYFDRIFGELGRIVEHRQFSLAQRRCPVIAKYCLHQLVISCGPTQQLCVCFQSVMAVVLYRDDRCDHFVILTRKRQIGRHQCPESRERVVEDIRDERMGRYYRLLILAGRGCVLGRIISPLPAECLAKFLVCFLKGNCSDPSHILFCNSNGQPGLEAPGVQARSHHTYRKIRLPERFIPGPSVIW